MSSYLLGLADPIAVFLLILLHWPGETPYPLIQNSADVSHPSASVFLLFASGFHAKVLLAPYYLAVLLSMPPKLDPSFKLLNSLSVDWSILVAFCL